MILHRRGVQIGLFVGILLAGILLFIPFEGSRSIAVPTQVNNVFLDPLSADWKKIAQTLDLDAQYGIRDFQLEYRPDGELQKLDLNIFEVTDSDKKTLYRIAYDQEIGHYLITKARANSYDPNDLNRLHVPLLFETFTPATLQSLVPEPNSDFIRLTFDSYYHSSFSSLPNNTQIFGIEGQQVIGPLQDGNGYLITVWPMYLKVQGSFSRPPRYFLLGGTS